MCTACTEDIGTEVISHESGYLEVYATIGEASTVQTRADETTENKDKYGVPIDELYSYKATKNGGGFADGCKIGIYSSNTVVDNDNKRLVNVPLTFKKKEDGKYSFINEDISIPSMTNLGKTFAYYPYSESNNNENTVTGNNLKYPIELYINDDNNPYPKDSDNKNIVIDLLKATNGGSLNSSGMISYTFTHACTMLLIYRGEGFNECSVDKHSEVSVKLKNRPLAYVYRTTGNFSLKIENDDREGVADVEYPTNFCEGYKLNSSSNPQDVYSVILPPEAEVEYIRLYDNFGTEQYVRPEKTMTLNGGYRYTVTVKLDGLYPTIYPHDITKWEDTEVVIDNNIPGIYDFDGFQDWISVYNNVYNVSAEDRETNLKKYGTKAENGDQWTFHLYADIDLKEYTGFFITTFSDKLEAHGHTISNIALQKTTDDNNNVNVGFVGTLHDGGINNLKIDGISFSSTDEINYVGTIAGTVTNGSITNCKITGIDIECQNGFVGALAGTFSSGTVETCLLEGELRLGQNATNHGGTNSYKLFGNNPNNIEIDKTKINTSGVYVFKSEIIPDTGGTDTGDEGSDTEDNTGNDAEGGN